MEMTPEGAVRHSSAKGTSAKPKVTVKPAGGGGIAKKSRSPRKTITTKSAAVEPSIVTAEPTGEDLGGMIATAAYYLAAARNFTPGRELDDWLEAERNILAKRYG